MISIVRNTLRKYKMVRPGETVVLAVSGGPDSMVLLHVMERLKEEFNLQLQVVHVDHMFRGEQSKQEALMVEQYTRSLGLPVQVFHEDVPAAIKAAKASKQAVARTVRYRCLEQVAQEVGAHRIATGHHADDQAETVLLHMLRGSGLTGLQGILPVRQDKYIRPLLEATRQQIEQYCQQEQLPFAIDPSNASDVYLRNRVRNQVLPLLKSINPGIVEGLNRLSKIAQAEGDYLEKQTEKLVETMVHCLAPGRYQLLVEDLVATDLALQRRIIRWLLARLRNQAENADFAEVESILSLARLKSSGQVLRFGRDIWVRRSYNQLIFGNTEERLAKAYSYILPVPGRVIVPEAGVVIEASIRGEDWENPLNSGNVNQTKPTFLLDLDKAGHLLVIRNRQSGDRFRPQGAAGGKKLKDFLIDQKIDRLERDRLPLIVKDGQVVTVGDIRANGAFSLSDETTKVLVIDVKPLDGPEIK